MPSTPPETAYRSLHALPPGTVLREYVVESVLGSGGFGVVYRARHADVGTPVAIKEYLPVDCAVRAGQSVEPGSGSATTTYQAGLQRFAKEAQQLEKFRRLSGIVSVRGFFHANGTAYLVMDYEDGLPLSEFLRRREAEDSPATQADLLAVAMPLLKALSVVHKSGVLHRDIKPANIFIRREDAVSGRPAEPVLIDFGAAKQVHAAHTRSQTSFCTPGYAPLEQLSTSAEDLGPWTDLYALGAVMWRMVAGGAVGDPRLYEDNTDSEEGDKERTWRPVPKESSLRSLMIAQGRPDPLPPATDLGRGRFAPQILSTIDRCLALLPCDRLGDCEELLDRLRERADSGKHEGTGVEDASIGKSGKFSTLAEVMSLVELGADINARDSDGRTPLGLAAEHGGPSCIKALIEAGAQVNSYDGKMWVCSTITTEEKEARAPYGVYDGAPHTTPLHRAARHRSPANVNALINAGADVDAGQKVEPGHTALHIAAMAGAPMTVRALLEAGADISARAGWGDGFGTKETALHLAAEHGSPATLRVLLRAGADIDALDWYGATALHFAAKNDDYPENIRVLLDAGISVDARTTSGKTPLHSAAQNGTATTINALLNADASIEGKDEYEFTALHHAAWSRDSGNVRAILDAGADIDAQNSFGNTALHEAVGPMSSASPETITELLDAGVDMDVRSIIGETALNVAALLERVDIVRILLQAGANINAQGKSGKPALHSAASSGNSETIKILLDAGAAVNAQDDSFQTALHRAAEHQHASSVTALLEAGADLGIKNMWGATPLHLAAEEQHSEVAEILLSAGANADAQDRKGRTPLMIAVTGDMEFQKIKPRGTAPSESVDGAGLRWRDQEKAAIIHTLGAAAANVDEVYESGRTALHFAAMAGIPDLVDGLLDSDGSFEDLKKDIEDAWRDRVRDRCPVLIHAQTQGLPMTVEALMEVGASGGVRDDKGWTPLHYAAWLGIASNVRALIDAGASVDVCTPEGGTPLHVAAGSVLHSAHGAHMSLEEVEEALRILEALNAGETPKTRRSARRKALQDGSLHEIMPIWLVHEIREVEDDALTRLKLALEQGVEHCMRMLIQAGCDVNAMDNRGRTALSIAAQAGFPNRSTLLREAGATMIATGAAACACP